MARNHAQDCRDALQRLENRLSGHGKATVAILIYSDVKDRVNCDKLYLNATSKPEQWADVAVGATTQIFLDQYMSAFGPKGDPADEASNVEELIGEGRDATAKGAVDVRSDTSGG